MTWATFTKIVDGFKEFDKKVRRFNLYKDGEPLLNPRFTTMVKYLREANVTEQIWTKTNGLPLCPELNQQLIHSGLDLIAVSIKHVSAEGYEQICKVKIDYDDLIKNIKDLYNRREHVKMYISMCNASFSKAEIDKFYNDFEPISDYVAIEGLHGQSFSAGVDWKMGTNNSYDGTPITEKIVCPLCLFTLAFTYAGQVALCNEDWIYKSIIGDATQTSVKEIWNSKERLDFMNMHLENRRHENPSCKECNYMSVLPDNVDEHRHEIWSKINER
jgi:radical SAM protein with 4Fe4S-binding SPASM domain